MHRPPRHPLHTSRSLKTSAIAVLLVLGGILFVAAIDRADWFRLRPASGTAAALYQASAAPAAEPAAPPVRP